MFTTPKNLILKTSNNPIDRDQFIKCLVKELKTTENKDGRRQVLANLANFAYDPINYSYIQKHGVIDFFLNELSVGSEETIELAIGGLCNLCLDKYNKEYIIANNGIYLIGKCLESDNLETVLSSLTTLLYLVTPKSKPVLSSSGLIKCIIQFCNSPCTRLNNLSKIYLSEICSEKQISEAKESLIHNDSINVYLSNNQPGTSNIFSSFRTNTPRVRNLSSSVKAITVERLITSEEVALFASLTGDSNPIHNNEEGRPGIIHGALLIGIVSGVIGTKLPGPGTIVLSQTINYPKPCYVGDKVLISVEMLNNRKISSCSYTVTSLNSKKIVLEGVAKLLIKNKSNL